MCGRYYVDEDTVNDISELVKEVDEKIRRQSEKRDVHPGDSAPVIYGEGGRLKAQLLRFGYPRENGKGLVFNARSETVCSNALFSEGLRYHRAVIPAGKFYEWNTLREMSTFSRYDGSTMYFAGIFSVFNNRLCFVIITTKANPSMEPVHDRMPLILEKNQINTWLTDSPAVSSILLQTPVLLRRETDYTQLSLF